MGSFISRLIFKKSSKEDYEQLLTQIDDQIRQSILNLDLLKISQKRFNLLFVLYSLAGSGLALFLLFVFPRPVSFVLSVLIFFGICLFLYLIKRSVGWYFYKRIVGCEEELKVLKERKGLKMEEFKKKSGYYKAKRIIERFEKESDGTMIAKPMNEIRMPEGAFYSSTAVDEIGSKALITAKDSIFPSENDMVAAKRSHLALPLHPIMNSPPSYLNPQHSFPSPPFPSNEIYQSSLPQQQPFPVQSQSVSKGWMDRLVDALLGELPIQSKYALVCSNCHVHNGLCFPDEINTKEFICMNCAFHNRPHPASTLNVSLSASSFDNERKEKTYEQNHSLTNLTDFQLLNPSSNRLNSQLTNCSIENNQSTESLQNDGIVSSDKNDNESSHSIGNGSKPSDNLSIQPVKRLTRRSKKK